MSQMKKPIIWIMFLTLLCPQHFQTASQSTPQDSLNSFLHDYSSKNLPKPHTGRLYDVVLPSNFSGIEMSILRLRTHSLWRNGVNLSYLTIPPRILPSPFTRRVDIVYQNLGNWSEHYYNVPNHTFVTPVVGFLAYDANVGSRNHGLVHFSTTGINNPIIVRFPTTPSQEDDHKHLRDQMKCVRFFNGTMELSNVTATRACLATGQGHFSVVIPYQPRPDKEKKFQVWTVGAVSGAVGLGLIIVAMIVVYKLIKWKKMREMERESEKSEGLGSVWINGESRLPAASGIRTQPVLENSYVP